jgi:hypothetical protein
MRAAFVQHDDGARLRACNDAPHHWRRILPPPVAATDCPRDQSHVSFAEDRVKEQWLVPCRSTEPRPIATTGHLAASRRRTVTPKAKARMSCRVICDPVACGAQGLDDLRLSCRALTDHKEGGPHPTRGKGSRKLQGAFAIRTIVERKPDFPAIRMKTRNHWSEPLAARMKNRPHEQCVCSKSHRNNPPPCVPSKRYRGDHHRWKNHIRRDQRTANPWAMAAFTHRDSLDLDDRGLLRLRLHVKNDRQRGLPSSIPAHCECET